MIKTKVWTIVIKNYTSKYYEYCLTLRESYQQQYKKNPINIDKHNHYIHSSEIKKVALINKCIVWYLRAQNQGDSIHIVSLHTETKYQNLWIGSKLLSYAEKIAKNQNKTHITLLCRKDNLIALQWYYKRWYQNVHTTKKAQHKLAKRLIE